jgi:hypothetical protein
MKVKWDVDGKGVAPQQGMGYSGPDLPKGSYVAKIKRMTIGKISKEGENHNKPRISVLLEVVGPEDASEYIGHPIWDGLNIIESGRGYVNAFLHALTDGSKSAKDAVEKAFWPPNGPNAKREANKDGSKSDLHVKKIGRYVIASPNGEHLVQIVAKPDSYQGKFRAVVDQYIPYAGKQTNKVADDDDLDDDDDDLIVDADELDGPNGRMVDDLEDDDDPDMPDDDDDDDEPPF